MMNILLAIVLLCMRYTIRALVFITTPVYAVLFEGQRGKLRNPKEPLLLKSATELAALIRSRKVTSEHVVRTFINQVKRVNPVLNAVVGERYDLALKEAAQVDNILNSSKLPDEYSLENAPFLGVPITIKECFALEGMRQTSGMICRKNYIADKDGTVVANLKKSGAIPIAITNVSELCMWMESSNLVYGRTNNAYHHGRIVGGSSGGEACIISSGASVWGVGSDIGGSIRMPAYFNGIFGHKPTTGIVCNDGQFPMAEGEAVTFLGTGPLCRYASDLMPSFKVMAGSDVQKLTLDKEVDVKKLKYYYMVDDGGSYLPIPVNPQIKKAIYKAVEHFRSLGAEVKRVNLKKLRFSFEMWSSKMNNSGNTEFCKLLADDGATPIRPMRELIAWISGKPKHTLPAIGLGFGEKLKNSKTIDANLRVMCDKLKEDFRELLGEDGVFLYPTHPVPAPYHNQPLTMLFNFAYTGVFNILGLPVTQVPMGLSRESVPIGLQVVGNYKQDHVTIAVAQELEKAFGGWVPPF